MKKEQVYWSILYVKLVLEVSKTSLIKWESNKAKPSVDNLLRICNYFDTDIYSLLEEVANIDLSHAKFTKSDYAFAQNFTINKNGVNEEMLKVLIDNHSKIFDLLERNIEVMSKIVK